MSANEGPMKRKVIEALEASGRFGTAALCRAVIEPAGGLTNRSYRVTIGSERYVLRLPGPGTGAYIDRQQEAHNAGAAARLGLAPQVMYADPRRGIQLVRYLEGGRALDARAFRDPAILEQAVGLLARLHRSGVVFRGEMAFFPKLAQYCRITEHRRPELLAPLAAPRHRAENLRRWIENGAEAPCPGHVDPAPSNFMRIEDAERRLYLLDWEYSARCEPMWDLADLSAEAGLSEEQDAHLLSCYYGRVGPEREDRFVAWKGLLHLLAAAWAAARLATDGDDADFRHLLAERAARAAQILESAPGPAGSFGPGR